MITTLQEILTSHILGLELPRLHNVSAHFIPHVTYLASRQGFTRHICIVDRQREAFIIKLKVTRNIRRKTAELDRGDDDQLWQSKSVSSYFLPVDGPDHESYADHGPGYYVYILVGAAGVSDDLNCQDCDPTETVADMTIKVGPMLEHSLLNYGCSLRQ